jgi:hypothetical protein
MASLLTLLVFLLAPVLPWGSRVAGASPSLLVAWAGTVAILARTHRADLLPWPALRSRIKG